MLSIGAAGGGACYDDFPMRILVTGGAGYIGSVTAEELLRAGHDVIVIDNLSYGHRAAVPPGAEFVKLDLLDTEALKKAVKSRGIEAVVHLAGSTLVSESVRNPALYYRNNVMTGLSLLEAMSEGGVRRIVFSSTAAVYGDQEKQPIDESARTMPVNPYGETKLAVERLLHWYGQAHGIEAVILRYFNAAGASEALGEAHDPETHLIPIVLDAAAGKRPHVDIYGGDYSTRDGTCVRDYVHVVDLASAHVLALESGAAGTYNVGCAGAGYTVREVIDAARRITGRNLVAREAARREGDPAVLIASSDRIRKELGWKPAKQDLQTIIGSAWDWRLRHPNGY